MLKSSVVFKKTSVITVLTVLLICTFISASFAEILPNPRHGITKTPANLTAPNGYRYVYNTVTKPVFGTEFDAIESKIETVEVSASGTITFDGQVFKVGATVGGKRSVTVKFERTRYDKYKHYAFAYALYKKSWGSDKFVRHDYQKVKEWVDHSYSRWEMTRL